MSKGLYDYAEPYRQLRYKYKADFTKLIADRAAKCVTIDGLLMKDGQPLRYMLTPGIQALCAKITELLQQTKVDLHTQATIYEGFYSAVIEGATTTLPETMRLVNGEKKPSDTSEHMVFNNVKLIDEYHNKLFPFTEQAVLSAWATLVDHACENEDMRGDKYRSGQVVVGSGTRTTFEPPQPAFIQGMMDRLCAFLQAPVIDSPLLQAIIIHYYFVYVHPFCDGNGRMARFLLHQWLIQNPATAKFRTISLSGAVNESRLQYYRALGQHRTTKGRRQRERFLWPTRSRREA